MSTSEKPFIHALADVQTPHVGDGTKLWQSVVALAGARIGTDCNICSHCFIENDVVVGDRVTIKNGVQLWDGLRVADDVFIGPNVTFSNDKYPRSGNREFRPQQTVIERGASLGAGAVILPGITIGQNAMIAAGAVVTKDVSELIAGVGYRPKVSVEHGVEQFVNWYRNYFPSKPAIPYQGAQR